MPLPALRPLDISPVEHEGQRYVCLQDPQGYIEQATLLTPAAFFIATLLDGGNDVADIQYHLINQFPGQTIPDEDITRVVEYLDERGFLATERFEAIREQVEAEFRAADTRPAHLAGTAYPEEPEELRAQIDGYFTMEGGPGERPRPDAGGGPPAAGLVVPHIDLARGGRTYAHGYARLAQCGKPKTCIIFGVSHAAGDVPFILTKKSFDTPFGTLQTDHELVARLADTCPWDPYGDEFAHRTEHSIEFQALMLAYLYGPDVSIVPILCAAFGDEAAVAEPQNITGIPEFLATCREIVAETGATVIAGADLAHVGRRFGDDIDITDEVLTAVHARDDEDLAHVLALDPDAFYKSVMRDGNARQVCGHKPIYSAMKAVDGRATQAELLYYERAPDPVGGIVSFASVLIS